MASESPPPSLTDLSPLSWTATPETSRWLGLLAYGLLAPLGGLALVLGVGGTVAAVALLLEGAVAPVAFLVLAVVVAFTRPPVLAALRSDEVDTSLGYDGWDPSWQRVLVASVLCGVALAAASLHSRAAMGAVAIVSFAAGLLAMALTTDATTDEDGQLETQYAAVDLSALSTVRSVETGNVAAFWLSYARGADSFRNPRLLAAPRERAAAVRERLDAGVVAEPDADPIGRTERLVVALFGLGVLATGPALWLLVGDAGADATVVLVYLVVFSLVFAAPMLWYAWKG